MNRRQLLRTAIATTVSMVMPGLAQASGRFHRDGRAHELDALARRLRGFQAHSSLHSHDVGAIRRRLLRRLEQPPFAQETLADAIRMIVASDYLEQRHVEIDGWRVSEFEYDLLILSAWVHQKSESSHASPAQDPASARVADILEIREWGPRSICIDNRTGIQRSGSPGIWVAFEGEAPSGIALLIDGVVTPVALGNNTLSARIDPEKDRSIMAEAGRYSIELYDPFQGVRQYVGTCVVRDAPGRSKSGMGIASSVFSAVDDWGPRSTRVGKPFNVSVDGASVLWVSTFCAPQDTMVTLGDQRLEATVGGSVISAKLINPHLLNSPGRLPLRIFDPITQESVYVGDFVIVD